MISKISYWWRKRRSRRRISALLVEAALLGEMVGFWRLDDYSQRMRLIKELAAVTKRLLQTKQVLTPQALVTELAEMRGILR